MKRCAIYTRKSSNENLSLEFNSLDAQRESAEAFIASRRHEGWVCVAERYDDAGYTGGNTERPALQRLLRDIAAGQIDAVVVYKVDRVSRSLSDFVKLTETLDRHEVALVSVTQAFDTTDSMGRLTLNILLSFAQFEREIISERTRDKIAAARRKGKWSGGRPLLGYDVERTSAGSRIVVNDDEAARVRAIFQMYVDHGSLQANVAELDRLGWRTKSWVTKAGRSMGGGPIKKTSLFGLLTNVVYIGKLRYREEIHDGEHEAIVPEDLWKRVQARLKSAGRNGGAAARNKHGALLRGVLRCGSCDCAMTHSFTTKGARRYRYYVCAEASRQGWHSCPTKSVAAGQIEGWVLDQIRVVGRDPGVIAETIDEVQRQAKEQIESLERDRRLQAAEIRDSHAQLANATEPREQADLHDRIRHGESRLVDLDDQLVAARAAMVDPADVHRALAEFDGVWSALTTAERCTFIETLVERVEYDGAAGTASITFKPTGIRALVNQSEVAA